MGDIFPTTSPGPPLTVAVHAVPQAYPLGQQPPPTSGGQVDQPVAQGPVRNDGTVSIPLPVGAIAVIVPSTTVMLPVTGHDVVSQFLPV